jgi:hypothetical protein
MGGPDGRSGIVRAIPEMDRLKANLADGRLDTDLCGPSDCRSESR